MFLSCSRDSLFLERGEISDETGKEDKEMKNIIEENEMMIE